MKKEREETRINLGCGWRKLPGFINIDDRPEVDPDMVYHIDGLPFADNSVNAVVAHDFLEHIAPDRVMFLISEIYRVLVPGGVFDFMVPSTDGRGAFQDFTHRSFWNMNSWLYFTNKDWCHLYNTPYFEILSINDVWTDERLRILHTVGVLRKPVTE